jgi:hypothetical protein
MQTLKEFRDWVIALTEDESMDTEIDLFINTAAREAAKMRHWGILKDTLTLTTDANGDITIPAYVRALMKVTKGDGTHPNEESPFALMEVIPDTFEVRHKEPYYIPQGISTAASTSTDECSVTQGSSAIGIVVAGGTWFSTTDVGKGVSFAGDSFIYEILTVVTGSGTEAATLYPTYRNATNTATGLVATTPIEGERVLRFYNENDSVYASLPVLLEYQRHHPKLYHDDDRFLLPCEKVLKLLVEKELLRNGKYDTAARNLDSELELAKHQELAPEMSERKKSLPQPLGKGPGLFHRSSSRRFLGK